MSINRKITKEGESDFFGNLLFLFKPYWPLFAILVILAMAGAWFYVRNATPVFETTAKVMIKDEKKGVEEAKTVESLDGFSGKKIIENEIEVLKSPSITDEVALALNLYAPVSEKTSFKSISAYTSSPVMIEVEKPAEIKKTEPIFFSYNAGKNTILLDSIQYPLNQYVSTSYGNLKFLKNPHQTEIKQGNFYFQLVPVKAASKSVNSKLAVSSANKLSSIVELTYQDEVPERGEHILQAILASYNNISVKDKNSLTSNTLNFIDDRLQLLKKDLDTIERKIQQFKSNRDAVDIGTQGKLFLENVSNNDQRLGDINMQLAVLNQVNSYVNSKNRANGIVPSTLGVNDPTLSTLVNKLYASELEYENIKKTAGENNPVAVTIKDQIDKIRPGIIENVNNQRRSLEISRSNLSSTNNGFYSTIKSMPEKERQLIDINREQGTKNQIYNFLLQKREETALSHASTVSNIRVVYEPRSGDRPVSPKKKFIYLSSIVLAVLAGLGIVLSKEKMRGKIMFIQDIEALTVHPIIGEITAGDSKNPLVAGEGRRTLIAEQFRKVRAAFGFLNINAGRKRILVTSSISGEGKSFVAANLALSLATTGKKVALLDFDLNNPSLNNKLSVTKSIGITEYLKGSCTAEEIIMSTDHNPNLFLLPTGELPGNPAELMMNGRVETLLNYLDNEFDYIIIDVAPIGPVTDAYILSPLCDATLYIVRHNYTPKIFVKRLDANNVIHRLQNIAIVFNGVGTRGFGLKTYDYGYGYQQAYGYVYDNKKPKLLPPSKNN